jgi:hypothetical protein
LFRRCRIGRADLVNRGEQTCKLLFAHVDLHSIPAASKIEIAKATGQRSAPVVISSSYPIDFQSFFHDFRLSFNE